MACIVTLSPVKAGLGATVTRQEYLSAVVWRVFPAMSIVLALVSSRVMADWVLVSKLVKTAVKDACMSAVAVRIIASWAASLLSTIPLIPP